MSTENNGATNVADQVQDPDIYGQVHPVETPELIEGARKDFEAEIERLPDGDKESLKQAMEKCPELLTDEFKLMFLRCEVFNADLAAKRYALYWEKRVEHFGPEKAFRPLSLSEALVDDATAMEIGVNRLTGTFDPSGRAIIFGDPSRQDRTKYARTSMIRCLWYTLHAALEAEETQRKGVIFVTFARNAVQSQLDRGLLQAMMSNIRGCLPVRVAAIHICHPPAFLSVVLPIIKLFLGARIRKRIRIHAGSEQDILDRLRPFGLTKDVLPTDLGGDIVLDQKAWIESRRSAGK